MMYPAAQALPVPSTPSFHIPDVVRGIMLLVALGVLAKLTLLNEHVIFGAVAWIAFLVAVALLLAAAARIVLFDARAAGAGPVRVERTRRISVVKEVVIAGAGALILLGPALFLTVTTSQQMWAGRVEEASGPTLIGLLFTLLFGVMGFFMTFWRPQFVLDRAARRIVRYPFGRSIPIRVQAFLYDELVVYSDGYFITNTGRRLGDMIRGSVGRYTFELEMLHGTLDPQLVQARARHWAWALGALYLTPEQAAVREVAP